MQNCNLDVFFRGFERIFFTRSLLDKAHRVTFGHFFCSHQKWRKVTLCALSTFSFLAFFLRFFLIIFDFFCFFLFFTFPRPAVCWIDKANFSRWFGGFGRGLEALGAFWSNLFWWFRPPPPAPCGGNAPTSTRMPRARPAPSLRRSAADPRP